VLLADDHARVAEQLRAILEPEFEVIASVGDGPELVAAAHALAPDVIVADISMPGCDGITAARLILEHDPGIRIVLVTIYNDPALVLRGRAVGVLGYVLKLTADEDLVPAVHAALRGHSYFSRAVRAKVS
jgi:DNA-binding NarL/FixJ family response regulator